MNANCMDGAKKRRSGPGNSGATETRLANSLRFWNPIKGRIRRYINSHGKGAAAFMAKKLGVANSQVHRWSCEKCEHDAEPVYSTGVAILLFLNEWESIPLPNLRKGSNYRGHRLGCPKEWRVNKQQNEKEKAVSKWKQVYRQRILQPLQNDKF